MPVLSWQGLDVDYSDDGTGPAVILIHGGANNNRQWTDLIDRLQDRHRVLAVNLRGTGQTSSWPDGQPQSMADQVVLIEGLAEMLAAPVSLVGHSFGGTIAMGAALHLGAQINKLVLIEPNPFYLLDRAGYEDGAQDIASMADPFARAGATGDWLTAGHHFIDYWFGSGSWEAMGERRRQGILGLLPTVLDAFPCCTDKLADVEAWLPFADRTLLMTTADTRLSVKRIRDQMLEFLPGLHYSETPEGGHMAAAARPDLVNPVVTDFLSQS